MDGQIVKVKTECKLYNAFKYILHHFGFGARSRLDSFYMYAYLSLGIEIRSAAGI